jgi:homoserine O-succinyltransferase
MPINLPAELPALEELLSENIFAMNDARATSQNIRPMQIGILNLMPNKIETELQILRLLSNTPLQSSIQRSERQEVRWANCNRCAFGEC